MLLPGLSFPFVGTGVLDGPFLWTTDGRPYILHFEFKKHRPDAVIPRERSESRNLTGQPAADIFGRSFDFGLAPSAQDDSGVVMTTPYEYILGRGRRLRRPVFPKKQIRGTGFPYRRLPRRSAPRNDRNLGGLPRFALQTSQ